MPVKSLLAAFLVAAVAVAAVPEVSLAMGSGSSMSESASFRRMKRAQGLIEDEKFEQAIELLEQVVRDDARNADAFNYLGFAARNIGRYTESLEYYQRALAIDPDHKGAHEYLGELYLLTGDLAAAQQRLAKLEELCPTGCEELSLLAKRIAEHQAKAGS